MTDDARPERDTTLSPFAQETRDRAEKTLTTLTVDRAEVESNIAELQGRLESIASEMAEAQLILDAINGKLTRVDDAQLAPAEQAPRAEWPMPEVDADLLERARAFAHSRDSFTVADLLNATEVFPEFSHDEDYGPVADSILTLLMGERLIHCVRVEGGDETMARYALIEPPQPEEPDEAPTEQLESARSEEGGVQPESEEAPAESEEGATPTDEADVLPVSSGADRQQVIDDAVKLYLADHPRSARAEVMEALTLTEGAASRSLTRLVQRGDAKIVAENPGRWSVHEDVTTPTPEPEPEQPSTDDGATTTGRESRRGGTYLSLEVVRDAAKRIGQPFNSTILAAWMTENLGLGDVFGPSTNKYIRELHSNGILERSGGERGPGVRYTYVKPNGGGPTTRPRHDHPRQLPKGASETPARGETVAHTGRAKGRSGKSGANKKKQALGFRVKTARGDRKRAG